MGPRLAQGDEDRWVFEERPIACLDRQLVRKASEGSRHSDAHNCGDSQAIHSAALLITV